MSVLVVQENAWPSSVPPSASHAAGQASVNTEPTTVLVGSVEPRGAQNRKPGSVAIFGTGTVIAGMSSAS